MNLKVLFTPLILMALPAFGGGYSYLDALDWHAPTWQSEPAATMEAATGGNLELTSTYARLKADGRVTIFLGMGAEMYQEGHSETLYLMLKGIGRREGIPVTNWRYDAGSEQIYFQLNGVSFEIEIGHERNEFARAFVDHDVVMYHGHSREGRGPAFGELTNYYRIGNDWTSVEVDARNSYFSGEEILNQRQYPLHPAVVDGEEILYQYRGGHSAGHGLTESNYTINVPGQGRDFSGTPHSTQTQIWWLYSCSNSQHWRDEFASRFNLNSEKIVFGTKDTSYWSLKPAAVFIMGIASQVQTSDEIVARLNATDDCQQCFVRF